MAKEFARAFYNSKRWKDCRRAYIAKRISIDGGMCETCHEVPGYIVHHKIELTPDNISDLPSKRKYERWTGGRSCEI